MEEDRDGDKNMKSLNEDIKTGVFKQIYLLYGERGVSEKQYKQKLTKAMISEDDTVNYTYYEGKGINAAEVIDLAETMPFLRSKIDRARELRLF